MKKAGVAYSVKEVRRAAAELHQQKKAAARARGCAAADDLLAVERQLRAGGSPKKPKPTTEVKLPEKYEMLYEFFTSMETTISLHQLKKSMTTLSKICKVIEHLTERRFTKHHLAQLKYLLPEVITVKKILVRDDRTCCMKPDFHVAFQIDEAVRDVMKKGDKDHSALRRVFRQRLVDFVKDHPEGDDIPAAELEHSGDHDKPSTPGDVVDADVAQCSSGRTTEPTSSDEPVLVSHMPGSFQRRFSHKKLPTFAPASPTAEDSVACSAPAPLTPALKPAVNRKSMLGYCISTNASTTDMVCAETNMKDGNRPAVSELVTDTSSPYRCASSEATPVKGISTPSRLLTATPNLQTPKRPSGDMVREVIPSKRMKPVRSLSFTSPVKRTEEKVRDRSECSNSCDADDVLNILPKSLVQSVKEKEMSLLNGDVGVDDAYRRERSMACLPRTFDTLRLIYQSLQKSVLTKEELLHKLIAKCPQIVDRGEVEQQLRMIQEILPDWISEKTAVSGDTLCRINTLSNAQELRQRLANAR